jgi:hypothetical protein
MRISCRHKIVQVGSKIFFAAGLAFYFGATDSHAENANWLAIDPSLIQMTQNQIQLRDDAAKIFDDNQVATTTTVQMIRQIMTTNTRIAQPHLADEMISEIEISATDWLKSLPKANALT